MTQEGTKIRMTLRLPLELHQILKILSKKRGLSISSLILNQLWTYADEKEKN